MKGQKPRLSSSQRSGHEQPLRKQLFQRQLGPAPGMKVGSGCSHFVSGTLGSAINHLLGWSSPTACIFFFCEWNLFMLLLHHRSPALFFHVECRYWRIVVPGSTDRLSQQHLTQSLFQGVPVFSAGAMALWQHSPSSAQ